MFHSDPAKQSHSHSMTVYKKEQEGTGDGGRRVPDWLMALLLKDIPLGVCAADFLNIASHSIKAHVNITSFCYVSLPVQEKQVSKA